MLSSYAQKGIGFALPLIVAFLLSGILLVIIGENPVKIYLSHYHAIPYRIVSPSGETIQIKKLRNMLDEE